MNELEQATHDLRVEQKETVRLEQRKLLAEIERLDRDNADERASALEAHIYTFVEPVNVDSVADCVETLDEWSRKSPGQDITVIFNTPGGAVFEGLALYDFIRGLSGRGHTITTIGQGKVFSMGSILVQAGDVRLMTPHSYLMIHEISSGAWGKASEIKDEAKLVERLQVRLVAILAARSKYTDRQIRSKWERKDWWLDADQALEDGFIDGIFSS